jgi:hypothetical protein
VLYPDGREEDTDGDSDANESMRIGLMICDLEQRHASGDDYTREVHGLAFRVKSKV